jgi:F-type H+-transporting ATPase subunit delta
MASGTKEKVAKRYARALFEVTNPQQFDSTAGQLKSFSAAWSASADLRNGMLNPRVSDAQRLAVINAVAQSFGGWVNEPTKRTIESLVELRKAQVLPSLSETFERLLSEYRKSLSLELTFAQAANDDVVSSLKGRLSQALGGEVALTVKTDPALLGGVTIRLGDKLLDRSVAGTLQRVAAQVTR